ncbi:MAG TPA: hypothetical protein DCL15_24440, partial [Chloroflexi bacterium]|nr:hypothetical protein [Chloroflexota bacterium]
IASITSRWPPFPAAGDADLPVEETVTWSAIDATASAPSDADARYEEETDEMDALDDAGR